MDIYFFEKFTNVCHTNVAQDPWSVQPLVPVVQEEVAGRR